MSEKPEAVQALVELLQQEVTAHRGRDFKAFVLFTQASSAEVEKLASRAQAPDVALCTLKGPQDEAILKYGINLTDPKVKTTAIVYKDRLVTANLINAEPQAVREAIAQACK